MAEDEAKSLLRIAVSKKLASLRITYSAGGAGAPALLDTNDRSGLCSSIPSFSSRRHRQSTPPFSPTPVPANLVTSDSLLNTGTAASITYTAPGTSSGDAIITGNSGNQLWELDPDPWGITSGSGTINMTYSGAGSITTTVNLTGLNSQGVNAYPMIFYGGDPWGDQIGGQPPQFPAQISSMSSLIVDASYSLSGVSVGDINILYDDYLIPSPTYTGGTGGALEEVQVLPYFSSAYGYAGSFVKTFTEPVTVNGTVTNMNFDEYSTGTGAGNTISFYAEADQAVISGEVRLNLLDFMNEEATTGGVDSSWWLAGDRIWPGVRLRCCRELHVHCDQPRY